MARIRTIEINNFRGISTLTWNPGPGLNCIVGPGDSGKSTLLEAIDLCVGPRRTAHLTDADFHDLHTDSPILIAITLGELPEKLLSLESYGLFLRSFDRSTAAIDDEPQTGAETVITIQLRVGADLDPQWLLYSDRAEAAGQLKDLRWSDRLRIAPTLLGVMAGYNLGWRQGSVLNRLTEERPDVSAALAQAAREARKAFGEEAATQLTSTLAIVAETARELGIPVGEAVTAMLDTHSVSFSGGTITLHTTNGIPLRNLGLGSTRLLTAGLQRKAAAEASIMIIDEVENGLEPHRLIRLLDSLGAKTSPPPLQVFMSSHSPAAICELGVQELALLRYGQGGHSITPLPDDTDIQATVRAFPEAFLSPSVMVCEGASEVGLIRGLDLHRQTAGHRSMRARGVSLVDANGESKINRRADVFSQLGYRTAILRDSDILPDVPQEAALVARGVTLFAWATGEALEDALFQHLPDAAVHALVDLAVELHSSALVDAQLKSKSGNSVDLAMARGPLTQDVRDACAKASKSNAAPWFKRIDHMETAARSIVGPYCAASAPPLREVVTAIIAWLDTSIA